MQPSIIRICLLLSLAMSSILHTQAQDYRQRSSNDTITVYAIVMEDGDTLALEYLENFDKTLSGKVLSFDQQKYWATLRHNVKKAYPYSIKAAQIINQIDRDVAGMSKKERKSYLKQKDKELKSQYKNELKNLTMTQGRILIKLINRHTGKDAYSLVKELKGGLTARVSQTGAYFFDNNLKATYDPYNEDQDIEIIVKEIEAQGTFK